MADTELDEAPLPPVHTGRDAVLVVIGYLIASLALLGPLGIFFPSMLIELAVIDEILLAGLCWAVVRLRWGAQAVTAMVRRPARPVAAIGIAATVGIVVSLVETGSLWLWELIASPLPEVQAWIGEELSAGGLVPVLSVVMALALAPLSEELFFRAVLYGGLRASWGFWVAALVSSGVFAVLHIDATLDSSLLLMGLIFPWGLLAAAVYQCGVSESLTERAGVTTQVLGVLPGRCLRLWAMRCSWARLRPAARAGRMAGPRPWWASSGVT